MQESIVFLVRVQCRRKESSRSLSHLLMRFLSVFSWGLQSLELLVDGQVNSCRTCEICRWFSLWARADVQRLYGTRTEDNQGGFLRSGLCSRRRLRHVVNVLLLIEHTRRVRSLTVGGRRRNRKCDVLNAGFVAPRVALWLRRKSSTGNLRRERGAFGETTSLLRNDTRANIT